ncbi:MAG TPA: tetratricopeptide repeat protein, partial [Actinomycetota bacterium]|nr:tetratricopeptide repeat protein [Actinomycetota bacterium]
AAPGSNEDAFWAVRKLLEHLARERPIVVVFDDIHWAEPTFLDLIDHLSDWTRDAAVLVLCIARAELLEIRPGWAGGKLNATSILLEPLPADAASELVDNLLGSADIPHVARERILEAAEGNPLFVEEMLAMLIDDGLLRLEDGVWRSIENVADVTIPPTNHLLLAARLDRLDAEERAVIERGAVEGKVFHAGAVTTLSPDAIRANVRSRLLALARKELIRPDRPEFAGEDAFRFRHLLIRDAAYQAMPKEQRAELHERFADWLEEAAKDRLPEYEEILAHHLEQAYRYRIELGGEDDSVRDVARRAVGHLLASARRADDRGDLSAARSLLERSVELAAGADRVAALVTLAELLPEVGEYTEAHHVAGTAVEAAAEVGDRGSALRAELVRNFTKLSVDPGWSMAQASAVAEGVLDEAERLDDQDLRDLAVLALAQELFFLGRTSEAIGTLDRLSGRAPTMSRRVRGDIAAQLAVNAYFGAVPVEDALVMLERAAQIRGESLAGRAHDDRVRGALLGMAGRFEEAHAAFDEADALYDELGTPSVKVTTGQVVGETLRLEGRLDEAERVFRAMNEAYDAMEEKGFNSTVCAVLAHVLCDLGRFDEAEPWAGRSREMSADDDFASQSTWRTARARVLADRGRFDEAVALVDEALTIAEQTDYLDWEAQGHEVRGTVLAGAGRIDEARAAFAASLDLFERKGNVVAAARLRDRIAALAETARDQRA